MEDGRIGARGKHPWTNIEVIGQVRRGYRQSDVDLDAVHIVINNQVTNERRPRRLDVGSRKKLAHFGQGLRHNVGKMLARDAPADTGVRLLGTLDELRVDLHGWLPPDAKSPDVNRPGWASRFIRSQIKWVQYANAYARPGCPHGTTFAILTW
jgi:hypothetical protein